MSERPPRRALVHLPTPVDEMPRLAQALGGPRLFVKRDDLTGLALGGNKARKLDRFANDALDRQCDVLVTGGGPQSNHARTTAAAACRLGLDCHLVLAGDEAPPEGNVVLDTLFGASLEYVGGCAYYDLEAAIEHAGARLVRAGRNPLVIPVGGASTCGVVAYLDAVDEMRAQVDDPDWIFVADGSGGTHAGILAGLGAATETRVVGIDVGTRPDLDDVVPRLAADALFARGRTGGSAPCTVDHAYYGDGYGAPTAGSIEALTLVARHEAIVLDPVYTSKAMAALIDYVRTGRIDASETVLFWHTGGAPALFASRYAGLFR